MGNISSINGGTNRRRISNATRRTHPPPPVTLNPEITAHPFVYPDPSPYPAQYTHSNPNAPFHTLVDRLWLLTHVNIKKETLQIEPGDENSGRFLVCFTFDDTVS